MILFFFTREIDSTGQDYMQISLKNMLIKVLKLIELIEFLKIVLNSINFKTLIM